MSNRRSKARERKREREQQQQQSRQRWIIGIAVVSAVVVAVLFFTSQSPTEAPIPDGVATKYENYITSTDDDGFPLLGNPNAPVTVREFSSFSCPGCEQFHSNVYPQLLPYVERGEINFIYMPLQTGSLRNAEGASRAAMCALEQDMFWEMHDVLFDWHSTFANTAFNGSRLEGAVQGLGLDVGEFNECFNSQRTTDLLFLAQQQGISGTPTIQVNGNTVDGVTFAAVEAAIQQFAPFGDVEPGIIPDEPQDVEPVDEEDESDETEAEDAEDAEAVDEATEDSDDADEATEESDDSDDTDAEAAESTEESDDTDAEAAESTEDADDAEATDDDSTDDDEEASAEPEPEATEETDSDE